MRTNYSYILILIFAMFLFPSCEEDFLEKLPLGEMTPESYFNNEKGAEEGTNAAYEYLRSWQLTAFSFLGLTEITSDDATKGGEAGGSADNLGLLEHFLFTPQTEAIAGWYNGNYILIARVNIVLANIDNADIDDVRKNQLKAENRFLRAYAYFNLVRAYGGVTLLEAPVNLNDDYMPRASAEEIWGLIDEDLLFAIENLPEKSEYADADLGRASKGAARGLLARAYLFRSDFANVEKYSMEIINSLEYDLYPDFEQIFWPDGENCSESVFEVQASTSIEINIGTDKFNTVQMSRGQRGWGFNLPSNDLINEFEPGDPRLEHTVAFPGDTVIWGDTAIYGYEIVMNYPEIEGGIAQYSEKATIPEWEGGAGSNNPGNVRIIRYADILLMAAEALNENGQSGDALQYLNMVRDRARGGNNSILPDRTNMNQSQLREDIWHERRVELAMEQQRYWDLIRQGRAAEVLHAYGESNFQEGVHELFPIPQGEIDVTEGVVTQNPGY